MCLIYNVILLQNHRHNLLTRHWLLSSRVSQQRGVKQGSNPEGFEQKNCHWSQHEKMLGGGRNSSISNLCVHMKILNFLHCLPVTLDSMTFLLPCFQSFSQYYCLFQQYTESASLEGKSLKDKKGKFSLRNKKRQENCLDTGRSQDFSSNAVQTCSSLWITWIKS